MRDKGLAIGIIIGIVIVGGGIYASQQLNETSRLQNNLPTNIPELPFTKPKSDLIGKSITTNGVEYTILDVQWSDTGFKNSHATEFTTFIVIEMKIENHNKSTKQVGFGQSYVLHDQDSTLFIGLTNGALTYRPSLPEVIKVFFEVPKNDSLKFTLSVPDLDKGNIQVGQI